MNALIIRPKSLGDIVVILDPKNLEANKNDILKANGFDTNATSLFMELKFDAKDPSNTETYEFDEGNKFPPHFAWPILKGLYSKMHNLSEYHFKIEIGSPAKEGYITIFRSDIDTSKYGDGVLNLPSDLNACVNGIIIDKTDFSAMLVLQDRKKVGTAPMIYEIGPWKKTYWSKPANRNVRAGAGGEGINDKTPVIPFPIQMSKSLKEEVLNLIQSFKNAASPLYNDTYLEKVV